MSLEQWAVFLFAISMVLFIPVGFKSDIAVKQEQESLSEERTLLASCEAGMQQANIGSDEVFGTESVRQKAVSVFYSVYDMNTGYNALMDDSDNPSQLNSRYRVPCIILMDWDGYYVCYPAKNDDTGVVDDVISEKFKWTKTYGTLNVEYRLNNTISVNYNKKHYEGYFSDVYKKLSNAQLPMNEELTDVLKTTDAFDAEKRHVVLRTVEDKANYFFNTHNTYFNSLKQDYRFTIPESYEDYEARVADTPTIIAFSQGIQLVNGTAKISAYAFTGADLVYGDVYYISMGENEDGNPVYVYHRPDCSEIDEVIRVGSMEECAAAGADPCHACIVGGASGEFDDATGNLYKYIDYDGKILSGEELVMLISGMDENDISDGGITATINGNTVSILTISASTFNSLKERMNTKEDTYYIDPQGQYRVTVEEYGENGVSFKFESLSEGNDE